MVQMDGPSSGQRHLLDDLEPVAPVERQIPFLGRLEVAGQALGVAVLEDRAQ